MSGGRAMKEREFKDTHVVLGSRWQPECFYVREFLQRNQLKYVLAEPARGISREIAKRCGDVPVVITPKGDQIVCRDGVGSLAEHLGMKTQPAGGKYDLAVVGFGPGGLQAGIYGASEGLRTLAIDRVGPGGQAGTTSRIENLMGFPEGISGPELARKSAEQARRLGAVRTTSRDARYCTCTRGYLQETRRARYR